MKIFVDMDGVLVDLHRGFHEVSGYPLSQEIEDAMGKERYWGMVDHARPGFWKNLPATQDAGYLLLELFSRYAWEKLHVLSARFKSHEECPDEKRAWITDEAPLFHEDNVHVVRRSEKKKFATNPDGTPNLLIDDLEKNIAEWIAEGGIDVHHKNAISSISQVFEAVAQYT